LAIFHVLAAVPALFEGAEEGYVCVFESFDDGCYVAYLDLEVHAPAVGVLHVPRPPVVVCFLYHQLGAFNGYEVELVLWAAVLGLEPKGLCVEPMAGVDVLDR